LNQHSPWEGAIEIGRNRGYGVYCGLAETYPLLGDSDIAYKYLNEMNKLSSCELGFLTHVMHSQMFAGIPNEERFQKIVQNLEAIYQIEHERAGQ
jgi:hypothetical protein